MLAGWLVMLPLAVEAEPFDTAAAFANFADPAELWGTGVEAVIERAYRDCFRTYILGGRVITLRMPFAQNNERGELADTDLAIEGGGKADPLLLWDQIDHLLETEDFRNYMAALSDGREKVIIFDLSSRSWSLSRDLFDIARMKAGAYRGLPHRPYVYAAGRGIEATDIYNYLYCIGRLGMDCSGFVWHILSATAKEGGIDLGLRIIRNP